MAIFFVYDKDGNRFSVTNKLDQRTAVQTGKYTLLPPGEVEVPIEKKQEGEIIEGVTKYDDKSIEDEIQERKGYSPNIVSEKRAIKRQRDK